MNIITVPKRGDIAIKRKSDKALFYVDADSISGTSDISSDYEVCAVVADIINGEALVVRPTGQSQTWCDIMQYVLTGYVLDNAEHTSTISIRDSVSASVNTDYNFTYTASTIEALVDQLNAFFSATEAFVNQDFYAFVKDGEILLQYHFTFLQQDSYIVGKNGFTINFRDMLPEIISSTNFLRKNGLNSGEGAISKWYRALTYFRNDIANSTYNPTNVVTSVRITYPICLPGYLGTSTHRDGDKCAFLRSVYGEGEEGWLKFMRSFLPVNPTDWGIMNCSGREITRLLANKRYNSLTKSNEVMCKAAYTAWSVKKDVIDEGEFWLPSPRELYLIERDVLYPSHGDRNSDVLNKTLNKLKWSTVSNTAHSWASSRGSNRNAWCSIGNYGLFVCGYFYGWNVVHAVSLYPITLKS